MATASTVGVLGAGTMGAGIAQVVAQAGARALLYDPLPEALERAQEQIASRLARRVARGRLDAAQAAAIRARVTPVGELAALAPCELAVEAAPERLELKRDLLARLAQVVAADCVLATNTSSLSVTEIAAAVPGPERVVGLHFFNPVPSMRLVELVAGLDSGAEALARARATAEAIGKRVIAAPDLAGFLVNRVNRPFFLEALRLLEQGVASVDQIDRIVRLGGGFRMGPFELMDLIGIDVNHAIAESFTRQSYGEPRYRPSPLAARMVAAGRLGRKAGQGWYRYDAGAEHCPPDPPPPAGGGGEGRVLCLAGATTLAVELGAVACAAGWDVRTPEQMAGAEPWLVLDGGAADAPGALPSGPRVALLQRGSLHRLAPEAVGLHALPPLDGCRLAELTRTPRSDPHARERAGALVASLGWHAEQVGDAPGLVLGRIVCQLVNEAAFLLAGGDVAAADVDAGMELGVNHPRGPLAWSRAIGLEHVLGVLDALHAELGEERYRAAPLLRQRAALGEPLA